MTHALYYVKLIVKMVISKPFNWACSNKKIKIFICMKLPTYFSLAKTLADNTLIPIKLKLTTLLNLFITKLHC